MSQVLNKAKVNSYSSFLSRPTLLHDLPEVSNVKTEFVYNYFKSDERIAEGQTGNQQGSDIGSYSLAGSLSDQTSVTQNSSNITNTDLYKFYGRNAIFSRFAKITFKPPAGADKEVLSGIARLRLTSPSAEIARENTSNVFSRYAVEVTDTAADSSFYKAMKAASIISNTQLESPTNTEPDSIYNNPILNSLNSVIQAEGYNFVEGSAAIENPSVSVLKGIQNGFSFLPQVAQDIIEGSLESMKNVYMDELQFLKESAKRAQEISSDDNPYEIRLSDFDTELNVFTTGDAGGNVTLNNKLVGYIVQKFSINEDGTVKIYPEKFIDSPNNTTFLDPDIAYGRRYRYRVLCIYLSDFIAITLTSGTEQRRRIRSLFASNGTDATLDCIDNVAPPPPVDLKFRYRADNTGLTISWNFPVNLQNDITKFQVLRRRTVNEPFELIKEYNFDSSIIQTYSPEAAPSSLIQRSDFPVTMHRDTEFTKDSKFIYAVVAIDAHGLTSNYSVQLEASYDRYRNKIITRLVSPSDAPKPYPNIFINSDTFVDTMKMSGYTKMSVYFDPEYVKVVQLDGQNATVNDLEHILYRDQNDNNVYKLMVTNTDFQESRVLDIKINNKYLTTPIINVSTARVFDPT